MPESTRGLASRWKRLGGSLVDSLIQMAILFPVMGATGVFKQIAQGKQISTGQLLFFFFFGMAVFLFINGYLLAKNGQTIGKKLVGTRIVGNTKETILPLSHIFGLRYLPLCVIAQIPGYGSLFCLIDILFIFGKNKRCVHDLIAGTKVVDA